MAEEVRVGQVQQVETADQLHPRQLNQVDRQERRDDAHGESADQPVAQRLLVLAARQPQDHDGHDEGVIRAQQTFERDEQTDGDEIRRLDVQDLNATCPASRTRVRGIADSDSGGETTHDLDIPRINT